MWGGARAFFDFEFSMRLEFSKPLDLVFVLLREVPLAFVGCPLLGRHLPYLYGLCPFGRGALRRCLVIAVGVLSTELYEG